MIQGKSLGALLVILGAVSYGVLATFVRLAYAEGFTAAEVTVAQFIVGLFALCFLIFLNKTFARVSRKKRAQLGQAAKKNKLNLKSALKLTLAGTSIGLTSLFYYYCVKSIAVSIAIVFLMQSVWMGVVYEAIVSRSWPSKQKFIAVAIVWVGTFLAANVSQDWHKLNLVGVSWGLLAAVAYTAVMATSNQIEAHLSAHRRSFFMLLGGTLVVLLLSAPDLAHKFDVSVLWKWGVVLGIFGTLLPPLLFAKGMPLAGIGLGTIVASIEIPVSAVMAWVILGEKVNSLQWTGIVLILLAVVIMNWPVKKLSAAKA